MEKSSGSQPGVRIPPGVRNQFAGGMQHLKSTQNKPILVFYLYKTWYQWVDLIPMGVRKKLQSCLGGTPKSNFTILGYAGMKRLRMPGIEKNGNLSSWFQACLSWTSLDTDGMSRRISSLGAIRWSRVAKSRGLGPPERPDASRPTCFIPPKIQNKNSCYRPSAQLQPLNL